MKTYKYILTELKDDILTITINRESALNAINNELMKELGEVFQEALDQFQKLKGIIITGAGEKAFAAGADIKGFLNHTEDSAKDLTSLGHQVYRQMETFPRTVIAAVNGYALGGGCELAMACHLRLASTNAVFGQPEVNLGVVPGYGGTQRLPQLVGKGKALEWLLTGDRITAEEAYQFGLVNKVVAPEVLMETARNWILKIASKGPEAIQGVIDLVNSYYNKDKNGFELEVETFARLMLTENFKEGVSAFIEKRKPDFKR